MAGALKDFDVDWPAPSQIAGTSIHNFVNKDADSADVQRELTRELRIQLSPTKDGPPSNRGREFIEAVRNAYAGM